MLSAILSVVYPVAFCCVYELGCKRNWSVNKFMLGYTASIIVGTIVIIAL